MMLKQQKKRCLEEEWRRLIEKNSKNLNIGKTKKLIEKKWKKTKKNTKKKEKNI